MSKEGRARWGPEEPVVSGRNTGWKPLRAHSTADVSETERVEGNRFGRTAARMCQRPSGRLARRFRGVGASSTVWSGDADSAMTVEAKCRSSISSGSCFKSVGFGVVSSCAVTARSASALSVSSDFNSVLVSAGSCLRHCRALL